MKRLTILAVIAGLSLLSVLVMVSGAQDVLDAVESAGWATALVVLARAIAITFDGLAWCAIFPPGQRISGSLGITLRWLREAINQLLPVAQVGGDFIGARLATFWRHDGALAGASVVVDIAVQAGTQFLFAVLGLSILVSLNGDSDLVRYIALGLVVAALGLAGFFLVQHRRGSEILSGLLRRFAGGQDWLGAAAVERFYGHLGAIYANRRGVAVATIVHMAVWIFGSVEVWIALRFMGHPVSVAEAIVIESLGQAVRGAAFAVPGALGVQEGGFIALCALFGVPAGPAVALSLLKRVADLALGIPGLITWQALEGRRVFGGLRRTTLREGVPQLAEGRR